MPLDCPELKYLILPYLMICKDSSAPYKLIGLSTEGRLRFWTSMQMYLTSSITLKRQERLYIILSTTHLRCIPNFTLRNEDTVVRLVRLAQPASLS